MALSAAGFESLSANGYPDADLDTAATVLTSAGEFAEQVLAPLNRIGDKVGAKWSDQGVKVPPGFGEAYAEFSSQGWNGLSADTDHGGQGLPKALEIAVYEIFHAANMGFGLCPMLTLGAIEALSRHGSEVQKRTVLPRLVSGEWAGTMNLTEPQAGSDLGAIRTKAVGRDDGGFRLFGQKIFITYGDHDMAENICHLVLARIEDAPEGVGGLSLFLATKRLVDGAGGLGAENRLRSLSIEHKLGIHGSPTCVMEFDGAEAELIGQPGEGLSYMFVMMNAARLQVGAQGVGIGERAFQQALGFSRDRRQGRSPWAVARPAAIFDHPDVRRMLLTMKSKVAAARGICLLTAVNLDRGAGTGSEAEQARALAELLIPIAKAWSTDMAVEVASLGLQVHGGMGFIEETGAAQHYRDARIAPIYEGANGVQAADLATRKLPGDGGRAMSRLCALMRNSANELGEHPALSDVGQALSGAVEAFERASEWMLQNQGAPALASSASYLQLAGDVVGGWQLGRQALVDSSNPKADARCLLARFFAAHVLARCHAAASALMSAPTDLEAMTLEDFAA